MSVRLPWGAMQIDMAHETYASAVTLRGLGGPGDGGDDDLMMEKGRCKHMRLSSSLNTQRVCRPPRFSTRALAGSEE